MNRKITVTIEANASIDGQTYRAGEQVETTLGTALQLVEMGVIAALPDIDPPPSAEGEDPALHERAKALAETMVGHAVAQATIDLAADRDNERRRADELALQLADMTAERDLLKSQQGGTGETAESADKPAAGRKPAK